MIIKYFFEPLKEFEIILIFTFDKFLYFDMFHDSQFSKMLLKYFKVIDVLIIIFGFEIDFWELYFTWIE